MQKQILQGNKIINYQIKPSIRSRRMRIAVYCDSRVVVSLPFGFAESKAEKYLKEKFFWILEKLEHFKKYPVNLLFKTSKLEYKKHKTQALLLAKQKVEQWNTFYNFSYNKVNIKNSKTRWGSCSKKKNLNFNYKIVHLPEKLVDYLVIHELCHLKEFNHSKNFWNLMAQTIPDFRERRAELRKL
jgi:predicted metal-dependent hydrolase